VSELVAALVCAAGGFVGGIVGVGGGILFVPAMVLFLDFSQVEAEATSLLMIVFVALAGTLRQRSYGNVDLRDAAVVGLLSPLGVAIGVVVANEIPQRALELAFAGLALLIAAQLARRALREPTAGKPG
jgi:uncharacterized protein